MDWIILGASFICWPSRICWEASKRIWGLCSRAARELIIYGDESERNGRFFSNFYVGLLIRSTGLEDAAGGLAALKADLGLRLEMKWKDITPSVEERYQMMMDTFLALVRADWIKVRIMFTQNPDRVVLTRAQARTTYHRLYYQFIQWGFGLEHAGMPDGDTRVRLLLDQMPTTAEQVAGFRAHICALTRQPQF